MAKTSCFLVLLLFRCPAEGAKPVTERPPLLFSLRLRLVGLSCRPLIHAEFVHAWIPCEVKGHTDICEATILKEERELWVCVATV